MSVTTQALLRELRAQANAENVIGMARFGMSTQGRLGISMPVLRAMGKRVGRNHALATELWSSAIAEARILAALIGDPQQLTLTQMNRWARDFDSWDVCDQVCMNLFDKTPLAWGRVKLWSASPQLFAKRAAFSLLACLAWHDKSASDQTFIELLPVIVAGSDDERPPIKKAVSWALRSIGKRNLALNRAASACAQQLRSGKQSSSRWIASDTLRELSGQAVQQRLVTGR